MFSLIFFFQINQYRYKKSTAKTKELLKELKKISKRAADYVSAQELVRSSLKANYARARKDHTATRVREGVYEVEDGEWRWTVDLDELSCTCSSFQEYGGPCSHAMSAIEQFSDREPLDAAYSFVNQKLWAKTAAKGVQLSRPNLGARTS